LACGHAAISQSSSTSKGRSEHRDRVCPLSNGSSLLGTSPVREQRSARLVRDGGWPTVPDSEAPHAQRRPAATPPQTQSTLVASGSGGVEPIRVTAVVPCCDEADGIDLAYERIATELSRYDDVELLFVDDGSSDGTLDRIKAFARTDPRVSYLSFTRNFGLEAAFSAGFKYASNDWVVQLDADLQSPPAEVHKLMAKALEGCDVVFGIRTDRRDPLARRLGSSLQQLLARRVLGIELPQGSSTFRVVRASVARKIAAADLPMPYFLATVPRVGARWTTVPTEHQPRTRGRSKFSPGWLLAHTIELFVGFSVRPLAAVVILAGVLATATALGAAAVATGRLGAAGAALAALAAGVLNLVSLAVIAGYLFRVVRGQPRLARFYLREANLPLAAEDDLYEHERGRAEPARRLLATRPRSLVILGGGIDQVPAYKAARRLGCRVIGVDRRADAPAAPLADRFLAVSTRDAAGSCAAWATSRWPACSPLPATPRTPRCRHCASTSRRPSGRRPRPRSPRWTKASSMTSSSGWASRATATSRARPRRSCWPGPGAYSSPWWSSRQTPRAARVCRWWRTWARCRPRSTRPPPGRSAGR
jgi:hypothetical protein